MSTKPPIINIDSLDMRAWGHGGQPATVAHGSQPPEDFAARIGAIGSRIGAQKLGYNLTVVPPGRRAFPLHNHRTNEEMFFVLEGAGELRIGDARHAIRAGDAIACPPGGPETAHQIVNTSAVDLKYLSISTKISPDVTEYPDSKKFGVLIELAPGADGAPRNQRYIGRWDESRGYWEDE